VDLRDKVVWITGASSGIGEALAHAYARKGARVVLGARRRDELERVARDLPNDAKSLILPADVTDFDAIPEQLATIEKAFGPVDVLVNNAGVSQRSLVADTTLETYRRLMEIDFFATVALTKAVLPGMRERRSGAIVVTSSVAGKVGSPLRSGYSAAKFALHGFYDCLRAEVSRDNISVTLAVLGFVQTNVSKNALTGDGTPNGVMETGIANGIKPAVVAESVVKATERGSREVVLANGQPGFALRLSRFAPGLVAKRAALRNT
jgi:short-subunit dehydrogenase